MQCTQHLRFLFLSSRSAQAVLGRCDADDGTHETKTHECGQEEREEENDSGIGGEMLVGESEDVWLEHCVLERDPDEIDDEFGGDLDAQRSQDLRDRQRVQVMEAEANQGRDEECARHAEHLRRHADQDARRGHTRLTRTFSLSCTWNRPLCLALL